MQIRSFWRNTNFIKLWAGQSISHLGDNFGNLAVPLVILQLSTRPIALGIYDAANIIPYLMLSLPAGALIDRLPRKPVMIICDTVRTCSFIAIALALLLHLSSSSVLGIIYGTALIISAAAIFFDLANFTAIPSLVHPTQLLGANSAMQASSSTSELDWATRSGHPLSDTRCRLHVIH